MSRLADHRSAAAATSPGTIFSSPHITASIPSETSISPGRWSTVRSRCSWPGSWVRRLSMPPTCGLPSNYQCQKRTTLQDTPCCARRSSLKPEGAAIPGRCGTFWRRMCLGLFLLVCLPKPCRNCQGLLR